MFNNYSFYNSIFSFLIAFSITSCVSKKNIIYFQNDQIDQSKVSNDFVTIFKPDDLLQISISADDLESSLPFNLQAISVLPGNGQAMSQPVLQNYLIDSHGHIDFPVLGKLKIGGKSKEDVINLFKEKLDPDYIKNPTVNIFVTNFKITVSGDVKSPGTFTIPNERVTILEAIGLAGDLNITAKRDRVHVIREEDGLKNFYQVDLRSKQLFTSKVYYLQQNDVIYVEPNGVKTQDAAFSRNGGLFISFASVLISLLTLISR